MAESSTPGDLEEISMTLESPNQVSASSWKRDPVVTLEQRRPSTTGGGLDSTIIISKELGEHSLPESIVSEARDHYEDAVRRGDRNEARSALESSLKQLEDLQDQDSNSCRLNRVELLLDLGRKEEARSLLDVSVRSFQDELSDLDQISVAHVEIDDSDREYDQILRNAILLLKLTTEMEEFEQADEAVNALKRLYPEYLDLSSQLSFFVDCRRRLREGALSEEKARTEVSHAREHLTEALDIYNTGCQNIEVKHFLTGLPNFMVWKHDHLDCANLFFSAARVCISIREHNFHGIDGQVLTPLNMKTSPALKERTWNEQALRFVERGRARALWDAIKRNGALMGNSRLDQRAHRSPDQIDPEGSVQAIQNTGMRRRKASWDSVVEETFNYQQGRPLKKRRVRTDPADRTTPRARWHEAVESISLGLSDDVSTDNILRSIPSNTAVVEYALASSIPGEKISRPGLIIIVTTSDGDIQARWEDLNRAHLKVRIDSLLEALELQMTEASRDSQGSGPSTSTINYTERVERLQDVLVSILVDPAHELLKSKAAKLKERLIIVPSGNLANVPWTMLFDKPICVVPSLSIWEGLNYQSSDAVTEPRTVFVAKKPSNSRGDVQNIQYARLEALHLAHLHEALPQQADNHNTKPLKELFRERDLIHLCAHGKFNRLNPIDASVQLQEEPLTILDWYGLDVKAKLVVFSSCLSAVAKTSDSGQGFGFSYALLSTGTQAFIGSLWPVSDEATLLFMMLFYGELSLGLPPVDALFKAQNDLRNLSQKDLWTLTEGLRSEIEDDIGLKTAENFVDNPPFTISKLGQFDVELLRNPAYWAAFTLVGNGFQPLYPAIL